MVLNRWVALLLLSMLIGGCDRAKKSDATVQVFAASSLTEAFADLEEAFEAEHPDVDIANVFAGSQVLRMQIQQGANASVFASANADHVKAVVDAGLFEQERIFARNGLCVVQSSTADRMDSFEQLRGAQRIVIGAKTVPVGQYTDEMLDRAATRFGEDFRRDVEAHVVSRETNVRFVRAKVEMGEADAAVVYCTDAAASDQVATVEIPEDVNVKATYMLAVRADATPAAREFAAFVNSSKGQSILQKRGFEAP